MVCCFSAITHFKNLDLEEPGTSVIKQRTKFMTRADAGIDDDDDNGGDGFYWSTVLSGTVRQVLLTLFYRDGVLPRNLGCLTFIRF